MKVNLNKREEFLLKNIMKPIEAICQPGSPVYYDMAVKLINNQLFGNSTLVTNKGRQLLMGVVQKIAYAQMDEQLEDILSGIEDVQIESTKSQSLKKVTNFTENHKQVVSMINKYPGISRRELADRLGWTINRVCPRVLELIELRKVQISGTKYDQVTGRDVESLEVV